MRRNYRHLGSSVEPTSDPHGEGGKKGDRRQETGRRVPPSWYWSAEM